MAGELLLAAKNGTVAQVSYWVTAGISVRGKDKDGRTALHLAAEHNNLQVANYLIGQNAEIDAEMSDGGTPIFEAVAMGHDQMVILLLEAGADPYCVDDTGWTLLHWAVSEGKFTTAKLLIERYPALKTIKAKNAVLPEFFAEQAEDEDILQLFEETNQAVTVELTKPVLEDRIKTIATKIVFDDDYYKGLIPANELQLMKWKVYIYLRKCVLDYRHGAKEELLQVIKFLEKKPTKKAGSKRNDQSNKSWFSEKLMDNSKTEAGEEWGSGSHEWLERSLIIDVLKRSAGMIVGVEAEATLENIQIDWLYIQAILRSPTKYLFLKLTNGMLREGHVGAVKNDLNKNAFCSVGSPLFHDHLEQAFNRSHSITSFIIRVHNIFKTEIISGKKPIRADNRYERYVVDGTLTNDSTDINFFRRTILRPNGYDPTNQLMTTYMNNTATKSLDEYSEGPINSESEEDNYIPGARRV